LTDAVITRNQRVTLYVKKQVALQHIAKTTRVLLNKSWLIA